VESEICVICKYRIIDGDGRIGMFTGVKWVYCHGKCEDKLEKIIRYRASKDVVEFLEGNDK
jgi:hypothetical protein